MWTDAIQSNRDWRFQSVNICLKYTYDGKRPHFVRHLSKRMKICCHWGSVLILLLLLSFPVEPLSGTIISSPSAPLIAGISPVNLTCTVAAGKADTVEWFKDGKPLATNTQVALSSDMRNLSFVKVEKEDAGLYKCQMKNKVNSDQANYTMVINCKCQRDDCSWKHSYIQFSGNEKCVLNALTVNCYP